MNRRSLLVSALLASTMPAVRRDALLGWTSPAAAQDASPAWRARSIEFRRSKIRAWLCKFRRYVNTDAPKGGTARQVTLGTFDNFNIVVGEAKGTLASGADLIYDTLLVPALDERIQRIRPGSPKRCAIRPTTPP